MYLNAILKIPYLQQVLDLIQKVSECYTKAKLVLNNNAFLNVY